VSRASSSGSAAPALTPAEESLLRADEAAAAERASEPAALVLDGDEECVICSAEARLVAARPCRHAACARCWAYWRKDHGTCLMCAQKCDVGLPPAATPPAASTDPLPGGEHALFFAARRVDESLEDALRSALRVKVAVLAADEALQTTRLHLAGLYQDAQAGVLDPDAASSIVAVEMLTVHEQVGALQRLPWDEVERTLGALEASVRAVERGLDAGSMAAATSAGALSAERAKELRALVASLRAAGPSGADKTDSPLSQQVGIASSALHGVTKALGETLQVFVMVNPIEGVALAAGFDEVRRRDRAARELVSRVHRNDRLTRAVRSKALSWLRV